jgi:hypothetical protein
MELLALVVLPAQVEQEGLGLEEQPELPVQQQSEELFMQVES